jgi:septal ring factor EnvC (AmiA/AmiB activator)
LKRLSIFLFSFLLLCPSQSESDLQEYSSLREDASSRTAKERAEYLLLEKEVAGMQRRVEEIQSQETFSRDEQNNYENMLKEYVTRLEKLQESIALQTDEKNGLLKEKEEMFNLSKACERRGNELQENYEGICAKLQDAGDARRATK